MPQIAFLFPGQGAQTVGMGRALLETLPPARQLFDEAAEVLGYDLAQVCLTGPAERLNSTVVSQPAIFVSSLAALESAKITHPDAVAVCTATAGLSLGEYTALVFAGALSFRDALRVVQARGEAMQAASDATPSGMVAVLSLEEPAVVALCAQSRGNETLEPANYLCPGNIVLSGTKNACDTLERAVEAAGGRAVKLPVAGAFHTKIMKPADDTLAGVLGSVEIRSPRIPVWSNVDASPHTDPREIRELLVRQVIQPVLWEKTVRGLLAAGFDQYYEIGPGRVLAGLLKRVQRRVECVNVTA
jgi:[acyl-carrier-protein] S-malonyltransferase